MIILDENHQLRNISELSTKVYSFGERGLMSRDSCVSGAFVIVICMQQGGIASIVFDSCTVHYY